MGPRAGLDGRKISPHRDSIPDRPSRIQSLYRLSYLGGGTENKRKLIVSHKRGKQPRGEFYSRNTKTVRCTSYLSSGRLLENTQYSTIYM